jgi:hypothetical protein
MLASVTLGNESLDDRFRGLVHALRLRPRRRGSRRFGYLHIAKTGGTSTQALLARLKFDGYEIPTMLGHYWTVGDVRLRYPRMRLAFVLRDPLERVISGFNTRLRGGPEGTRLWSAGETAIFSIFPTAESFLAACASDDPFDQVAARTAMRTIEHLRLGYGHHFGTAARARALGARVYCVGSLWHLDSFHSNMLAPLGIDESIVRAYSTIEHRAPVPASSIAAQLSEVERAKLREFLRSEYDIYESLIALAKGEQSP